MKGFDINNLLTIIQNIDCVPEMSDAAVDEVEALFDGAPAWIRVAARTAREAHRDRESDPAWSMIMAMRCAAVGAAVDVLAGTEDIWTEAMVRAFWMHRRCTAVIRIYYDVCAEEICDAVSDAMEQCERVETGLYRLGINAYRLTQVRMAVDYLLSAWSGLGVQILPERSILPTAIEMMVAAMEEIEMVANGSHAVGAPIDPRSVGSAWGI